MVSNYARVHIIFSFIPFSFQKLHKKIHLFFFFFCVVFFCAFVWLQALVMKCQTLYLSPRQNLISIDILCITFFLWAFTTFIYQYPLSLSSYVCVWVLCLLILTFLLHFPAKTWSPLSLCPFVYQVIYAWLWKFLLAIVICYVPNVWLFILQFLTIIILICFLSRIGCNHNCSLFA